MTSAVASMCVLLMCMALQLDAYAQIPADAVPATAGTMYYAGGTCTFYSQQGQVLLTVDPAEAQWSCSPAKAAWVVVRPTSGGYYEFPLYTSQPMTEGVRELTVPFLSTGSDTIYKESILLSGVGTSAPLLYEPRTILRVENYDGSVAYDVGDDVTLDGRVVTQRSPRVSKTVSLTDGKRGNGMPNGLVNTAHTSWTRVTYVADRSSWTPPAWRYPESSMRQLPRVRGLLAQSAPVTIQAVGMSITAGHNVSGGLVDQTNFPPTAPFMRGYCELVADALSMRSRSFVKLYNSSCSGKTIGWAASFIVPLAVLNSPDLVILDMGMNDIWGQTSPEAFRSAVIRCIDSVRRYVPHVEFLIIANMIPDTSGAGAPKDGASIMRAFAQELRSLEPLEGVAVLDMTSLSEAIMARKGAASCTANALHPNDYLVRWYAQTMLSFFQDAETSVLRPPSTAGISLQMIDDVLVVESDGDDRMDLVVLDLAGRIMILRPLQQGIQAHRVPLHQLPSGAYLVHVRRSSVVATQVVIR